MVNEQIQITNSLKKNFEYCKNVKNKNPPEESWVANLWKKEVFQSAT